MCTPFGDFSDPRLLRIIRRLNARRDKTQSLNTTSSADRGQVREIDTRGCNGIDPGPVSDSERQSRDGCLSDKESAIQQRVFQETLDFDIHDHICTRACTRQVHEGSRTDALMHALRLLIKSHDAWLQFGLPLFTIPRDESKPRLARASASAGTNLA